MYCRSGNDRLKCYQFYLFVKYACKMYPNTSVRTVPEKAFEYIFTDF